MKILFIDTETTGLDERQNKVVEISAILYDTTPPKSQVDSFSISMHYGSVLGPISMGALSVNGRTIDSLESGSAPSVYYTIGIKAFADWLVKVKREHRDFLVAGHNVHFDIKFLTEAFNLVGLTDLEQLIGHRYTDTASIAFFLKDLGLILEEKAGSSSALAKEFSFDPPKHTTTADVEFTWKLYNKLKSLVNSQGIVVLAKDVVIKT